MIRDLLTPGSDGSPAYRRAVIGMAHALLGASIAAFVGGWLGGLGVALAYWVVKEWGDLRRGGTLWDGIEDALMVWVGTLYGPHWWPVAALAAGGVLMLSGATRDRS